MSGEKISAEQIRGALERMESCARVMISERKLGDDIEEKMGCDAAILRRLLDSGLIEAAMEDSASLIRFNPDMDGKLPDAYRRLQEGEGE